MPPSIGLNAQRVLKQRYSLKDNNGNPIEEWEDIVNRVVNHAAQAEPTEYSRENFRNILTPVLLEREFIPNTPCLVNSGKPKGQLAACFVLPVEDSIDGIMEHAKTAAIIHQTGGGTGMSYEKLRPAGSAVNSTHGVSSGPVSFMNIVNETTEVVKQGGVRRGANMGMLSVTHPDILRFIHAKNDQSSLTNFNISVTVTDAFIKAVNNKEWFQLEFNGKPWTQPIHDPTIGDDYMIHYNDDHKLLTFTDKSTAENLKSSIRYSENPPNPGMVYALDVWNRIVASAHKYAEPGIAFIDEVNRHNHLASSMGQILSCNPCGEQFLHGNNSCNLGSIDISKFWKYGLDRGRLQSVVFDSIRFLDNVIDVGHFPIPDIADVVKRTRPIGLGIMGFADFLLKEGVRYGSEESFEWIRQITEFVQTSAWLASIQLGSKRGVFPELEHNRDAYAEFLYNRKNIPNTVPLTPRNYEVTTIAPTGTISLVAETSSGIEPNFSWAYVRRDTVGTRTYVHPIAAQQLGIDIDYQDEASMAWGAEEVLKRQHELPDFFVTATDVSSEEHVKILGAAQQYVDNSISKTCNGAADDTVESVDTLYRLAYDLKCKAVSYYRDGSRQGQVLTSIKEEAKVPHITHQVRIERPQVLEGMTWRVPFDGQNLYVTINHDSTTVLEVFVRGPISEGVGFLASKMLRGGFSVGDVAESLDKIHSTHSLWFNKRLVTSPEQVVAECLLMTDRKINRKPLALKDHKPLDLNDIRPAMTVSECPECRGMVERASGCDTCRDCGYSKCK